MSALGTRRRAGSRADLPFNAEINVTSLVDVAFTLLVIFIITAPILQGGIEVAVPKADVDPVTAQDKPFFVTVLRDGSIFMEETPMTPREFEDAFPLVAERLERVYIRADSLAPYGPVLKVIATAARAGVTFAVVGEPYSGR
ncbi:MAG: biopolymer transporter ExbD [Gemmatimonadota bacterium]|nr:biopolymer transporter ExbD [Gemmatimonadota bacterium]